MIGVQFVTVNGMLALNLNRPVNIKRGAVIFLDEEVLK